MKTISGKLETERLILREPGPEDIQFFRVWLSDPATAEHVGGVRPEERILIAKEFWGRGFATEAARAVMKHAADELGLDRVTAWPSSKKVASLRVVEKLGFFYEKQIHETHAGVSLQDMCLYVWKRFS